MDTQTNTPYAAQPAEINPVSAFAFPKAGKIFGQAAEIYKTQFRELILITLCQIGVTMAAGFIFGAGATYLGESASGSEKIRQGWCFCYVISSSYLCSCFGPLPPSAILSLPMLTASAGKSFRILTRHNAFNPYGAANFVLYFGRIHSLNHPWYYSSFLVQPIGLCDYNRGFVGKKALDQSNDMLQVIFGKSLKRIFIGIITFLVAMGSRFSFGITATLLDLTFRLTIAI